MIGKIAVRLSVDILIVEHERLADGKLRRVLAGGVEDLFAERPCLVKRNGQRGGRLLRHAGAIRAKAHGAAQRVAARRGQAEPGRAAGHQLRRGARGDGEKLELVPVVIHAVLHRLAPVGIHGAAVGASVRRLPVRRGGKRLLQGRKLRLVLLLRAGVFPIGVAALQFADDLLKRLLRLHLHRRLVRPLVREEQVEQRARLRLRIQRGRGAHDGNRPLRQRQLRVQPDGEQTVRARHGAHGVQRLLRAVRRVRPRRGGRGARLRHLHHAVRILADDELRIRRLLAAGQGEQGGQRQYRCASFHFMSTSFPVCCLQFTGSAAQSHHGIVKIQMRAKRACRAPARSRSQGAPHAGARCVPQAQGRGRTPPRCARDRAGRRAW